MEASSSTLPGPVAEATAARYGQLTASERAGAEYLEAFCRATGSHGATARQLSNRSFLQSLASGLPLALADFALMWGLVYVSASAVRWALGGAILPAAYEPAWMAAVLLLPIGRLAGVYPALGASPVVEFRQLVRSAGLALAACLVVGLLREPQLWLFYIATLLGAYLLSIPLLPSGRYLARCLLAKCPYWGANALIYADPELATVLYRQLARMPERGIRPVGVLLSPEDYWNSSDLVDDDIPTYDARTAHQCAQATGATWVLMAPNQANASKTAQDMITTALHAIPHRIVLSTAGLDIGMWDEAQTVGPACGLRLGGAHPDWFRQSLKRLFDILFASAVLLVCLPAILLIALAIRLTSPGPIFYSQERIGRGGRPFKAWKFRSMRQNADAILEEYLNSDPGLRAEWETTHKLRNDPRVTWIGQFLRKTSLDELPQLWNVLRGEMSVVGPRPIVDSETYDRTYIVDYPHEFSVYTTVRPGLTGLWQVTCRNNGVYELRIYWDMYYIRNWSLWFDAYIVLRTIRTVLLGEGAA